jgi:glycosyltransferase involved in cell wall biosynthesis
MNVLHVGTHLDRQRRSPEELLEAWPTLTDLAVAVSRAGATVKILQVAGEDATLERNGIACEFVAERVVQVGRRDFFFPRRLAKRLAELRPDIIHVHGLSHPVHVRWLQRAVAGTRVLVQHHGGAVPRGWRIPLYRWGLAKIDAVSFTSSYLAAPFQRAGCFRAGLPVFEVVESSSWFTPGDQVAAREVTGLGGDPCLLCVGRLIPDKDPETLLEAVRLAARHLPELHLWWCYTEAPLLAAVERQIAADPGLRSRVHLVGRVPHDRMEEFFRAADMFVLPSLHEGSGYSLLEALATGLTPVVSDIPAFRKITGDGAVGMLAPVSDPEALSQAIVRLASADRGSLRAEARSHFERTLSFDLLGAQLANAYDTLVST